MRATRPRPAAAPWWPAVLLCTLALAGCGSAPTSLYDWGRFPPALHDHLRSPGADPGAHVARLEEQIVKSAATGRAVPPGLHAHLALLYDHLGEDDKALAHLQAERRLFAESAVYVDFLLQRARPAAASATSAAPAARAASGAGP